MEVVEAIEQDLNITQSWAAARDMGMVLGAFRNPAAELPLGHVMQLSEKWRKGCRH